MPRPPELQQALSPEDVQCAQHGVLVHVVARGDGDDGGGLNYTTAIVPLRRR
jgi:hypothetical protein